LQKIVPIQTMNDFQITQNFNLKEFECPCCGLVMIDKRLVDYLQAIRNEYGAPIITSSGYRCQQHNLYVGGKERSDHLYGLAADITTEKIHGYNELGSVLDRYTDKLKIIPHPSEAYFHVALF